MHNLYDQELRSQKLGNRNLCSRSFFNLLLCLLKLFLHFDNLLNTSLLFLFAITSALSVLQGNKICTNVKANNFLRQGDKIMFRTQCFAVFILLKIKNSRSVNLWVINYMAIYFLFQGYILKLSTQFENIDHLSKYKIPYICRYHHI